MTTLSGQFQILWIMVTSMKNDQIFQAPCDIEFPLMEKAEIASTQKRSLSTISQVSLKDLFATLRLIPIARCYAWTLHPDFTEIIVMAAFPRIRCNNGN